MKPSDKRVVVLGFRVTRAERDLLATQRQRYESLAECARRLALAVARLPEEAGRAPHSLSEDRLTR